MKSLDRGIEMFDSMESSLSYWLKSSGSLSFSLAGWSKAGFQTTTPEQLESRMEICKGCEFWSPKGFRGTGSCQKCGCSTQAKLRMATSKCPIDKWGPVDVVKTD